MAVARLRSWIGQRLAGAATALHRFPEATVFVTLFAILSNVELADFTLIPDSEMPRHLSALAGAAAVSVALRLVLEAWRKAGLWTIVPLLGAGLLAAAIYNGEPLALFAGATLPAALASILVLPFVGRGTSRQFWIFALWTIVGGIVAFVSVLLFVAGFLAILEMVRFLFRIRMGGDASSHILVTALTFVGPIIALGTVPSVDSGHAEDEPDARLMRTVGTFLSWVAVPLAFLTAFVLHLYAGRILLTGEMPVGEIGWIVAFVAVLVVALRIAVEPFIADDRGGLALFGRAWSLLLIVPLILLAVAVQVRIASEGVTAERYYLALGAVAAGLLVFLQIVPRVRGDIRFLAAVPVALLLLSVAGPLGVATRVGESQIERIRMENPTLARDALAATPATWTRLRSRINALDDVGQLPRIASLLPPEDAERVLALGIDSGAARQAVVAALGLDASPPRQRSAHFEAASLPPLDLTGFDRAFLERHIGTVTLDGDGNGAGLRLGFSETRLVLAAEGLIDTIDLEPVVDRLASANATFVPVFDLRTADGRSVRVVVARLEMQEGQPRFGRLTLLIRTAEWPSGSLGSG